LKTTTKILIIVGLILLGGIIFSCVSLNKILAPIFAPRPRPTPAPISDGLKKELCEKLDDSRTEAICINNNAILASDTIGLFEKKFTAHITTQDDIVNLLGPARWEDVTPFYMYTSYHQFDLAGTGVNRIVTWSDHKGIIKSVVFIRADVRTSLPENTVSDLCKSLELTSEEPCTTTEIVYAQDFFPFIKEKFLDKPIDAKLFAALKPYAYTETQHYSKLFFRYNDNVSSRVLFYFDGTKKLDNIAFVGDFLPTPLDPEVLYDLCKDLQIDMESDKCKSGAQTYTTDLNKEIRAAFPIGKATYEDVQNALAKYQYEFTYPVRDATGRETTLSWYDFVGNNYTRIRFDFDNNFIVRQIQFFSGGS
jgi:hypothetical protein